MERSGADAVFREHTNLSIDPTWYSADVGKLEELCTYPFLFAQSIHEVESDRERRNLAEFIRRGGFLLIDGCINPDTRPLARVFLVQQKAAVALALPEAKVVLLPNDHEIYRCFFEFIGGPPHTSSSDDWGQYGLYAIYLGARMAGVISTSGLQRGWDRRNYRPNHDIRSMEMLVNIYIFAMMQGGK